MARESRMGTKRLSIIITIYIHTIFVITIIIIVSNGKTSLLGLPCKLSWCNRRQGREGESRKEKSRRVDAEKLML